VSRVSETGTWVEASAISDSVTDLHALALDVRARIHALERDDPDRVWLVNHWHSLDQLERRLRAALAGAGRAEARPVGEDTQAWLAGWLPQMPRNRGPR